MKYYSHAKYVIIRSPSRLHFTLIDMNGAKGRIDGSVGLALAEPGLVLKCRQSREFTFLGSPSLYEFVRNEVHVAARLLGVQPRVEICVLSDIPRHRGLGSGTQWRLSILSALNAIFDLGKSTLELATISGRGGTSGIGVYSQIFGGFLIDGGHRLGPDKSSFNPSRFADATKLPPLVARHEIPDDWGIVLWIPAEIAGLEGESERLFMHRNVPVPMQEVETVTYIVLMQILPGVASRDLHTFASGVDELQAVGWKLRHWGRPELEPLIETRVTLRSCGLLGVGLSSTGSTLFGFFSRSETDDSEFLDYLHRALENQSFHQKGNLVIAHCANSGAEVVPVQEREEIKQ